MDNKAAAPLALLPGQFQLQANLGSITGDPVGGYLRITLCGFGPVVPFWKPGPAGMLANAGVPQTYGPQVGSTPLLVTLWTNTSITPDGTFYEIAVEDASRNVIQCGNYQFSTSGVTVDLSTAVQIVSPYGFPLSSLKFAPCTGTIPGIIGTVYTAPGSPVLAVAYNGIFLRGGQSLPTLSYTVVGTSITLNFATQAGDRIDAFCISNS
jgi:hypothetical protein